MFLNIKEELKNKLQESLQKLGDFAVDHFGQNKKLYDALIEYEDRLKKDKAFEEAEKLTDRDYYYLENILIDFESSGLLLPDELRKKMASLSKELSKLEFDFEMNIAQDNRFILATKEELKGLDEKFIVLLEREGKAYKVGIDRATYVRVMRDCLIEETRKRLFRESCRRGYPANETVLKKVIELRDTLAKLAGFKSFAALDIKSQMAKTVKNVEQFLQTLLGPVQSKAHEEYARFNKEYGENAKLTSDNKFYPWNVSFAKNNYKKKSIAIDEYVISKYFPIDYTLPAILGLFEKSFSLSFKLVDVHYFLIEQTKAIEVYQDGCLMGVILLDLFARAKKTPESWTVSIIPR